MNPRERLLTALQHGTPDSVPVSFFIQDYFVKDVLERAEIDPVDDVMAVGRELGLDMILRPEWLDTTYFTKNSGPNWEVEQSVENRGDYGREIWTIHTPKGDLRQVYTVMKGYKDFSFFGWEEHFIKSERDLDLFEEFEPPLSFDIRQRMQHAIQVVGQEGIVAPWLPDTPFNQGFYLRGLQNLLLDIHSNNAFYERLMRFRIRQSLSILPEVVASQADLGCVGGNVANARLLSRKYYEKYVLPYDQAYVQAIENMGLPVLFHNCGYIMPFLESYLRLGCRALESFTPPPNADGDLAVAKERIGDRMVLVGNLDQIGKLRKGTPVEIEAAVREALEAGAPGGGFILGTADHLYDETPLENVRWAVEVARKYGNY
jgi:uroporphyrinogen decarboxylase